MSPPVGLRSPYRTVRAWPWTLALAAVLAGFVAFGLLTAGLRASASGQAVGLAITAVAAVALARTLATGVQPTPTGLVIRELTRTRRVPWTSVRGVDTRPSGRRAFAPVLLLPAPRAVKGARRGRAADEPLELTVLASYREVVAWRRAEVIDRARAAASKRPVADSQA